MLILLFALLVFVLLGLILVGRRIGSLAKYQVAKATFIETELKEIKAAQVNSPEPLAYGWHDGGWPIRRSDEEDRAPLESPAPQRNPDDYATQMYILEYGAILDAHERKEFLLRLHNAGVWMKPKLLDAIYADESAFVRAWAAGHLATDFKDYTDRKNPHKIRDYEPNLLQSPEPAVRAALWSNPECTRLPWSLIWVSEGWKEQLQSMSQMERLGLMRNPELSKQFVVALLETPSGELNMTRKEHAEVLCAAAVNPDLIGSSRFHGRKGWVGGGEGNSPFEEFGRMWIACLDKWTDEFGVLYWFFKYIQTTPEIKLAVYSRLLEGVGDQEECKELRIAVIRSCDPFDDGPVLKAAWNDPDEKCREIARERVGGFGGFLGLKETNQQA